MQYVSPYRLWEHIASKEEKSLPEDARLLRKRLLLEQEIQGGRYLHLGENTYSRDDILRLTEQWESSPEVWAFHRKVAQYPVLLAVLESGHWWGESLPGPELFEEDAPLLAAWLAPVMQQAVKKVFVKRDFPTGLALLQQLPLLHSDAQTLLYAEIMQRGELLCNEIERHTLQNLPLKKDTWAFLKSKEFYMFFNETGQLFAGLRNRLAQVVNNQFAMQINHRQHLLFCGAVLSKTLSLSCSTELHEYLRRNRKRVPDPADLRQGIIIMLIALIVYFLIIVLARSAHAAA